MVQQVKDLVLLLQRLGLLLWLQFDLWISVLGTATCHVHSQKKKKKKERVCCRSQVGMSDKSFLDKSFWRRFLGA